MTEAQEARFVELMKSHINIIESRKHDIMALESKNKAWRKIHVEYNAEAQQKRSENQLRILWKDLKAKAKKAKAKQNRMKFKTGGGPPPDHINYLSQMIIDMIPQIFAEIKGVKDDDDDDGDNEDFDDNILNEKNEIETQANSGENAQKDVVIFHENSELETNVEEQHSPPKNVPGSSYIKKKGKSRKQNRSTDLGDKVLDFHSMKIKLMQEEHNAKMLLIDRQKEIMEEEHNLRMEILRKWKESAKNCQSSSHSNHKTSDIILNNFVDMGNMFYGNDPF